MQIAQIIQALDNNSKVFRALFNFNNTNLLTYKPEEHSWCYLEIVGHLIDEEKEDFKARVAHCLHHINQPLRPITPTKWPLERQYLDQNFQKQVDVFLKERENSVVWFQKQLQLQDKQHWQATTINAQLGPISAL